MDPTHPIAADGIDPVSPDALDPIDPIAAILQVLRNGERFLVCSTPGPTAMRWAVCSPWACFLSSSASAQTL